MKANLMQKKNSQYYYDLKNYKNSSNNFIFNS